MKSERTDPQQNVLLAGWSALLVRPTVSAELAVELNGVDRLLIPPAKPSSAPSLQRIVLRDLFFLRPRRPIVVRAGRQNSRPKGLS